MYNVSTLSDISIHFLFAVSCTMLSYLEIKRACSTSLIKIFKKQYTKWPKQCFSLIFWIPWTPKARTQNPEPSLVWNHENLKTRWIYHLLTFASWFLSSESSDPDLWERVFGMGWEKWHPTVPNYLDWHLIRIHIQYRAFTCIFYFSCFLATDGFRSVPQFQNLLPDKFASLECCKYCQLCLSIWQICTKAT